MNVKETCPCCGAPSEVFTDSIATPHPMRRYIPPEAGANARMLDVLNEVAEFLDGQSDVVDGPDGGQLPNRAMSLLLAVEVSIENLKERSKPQPSES